jgi:hypothetical protein
MIITFKTSAVRPTDRRRLIRDRTPEDLGGLLFLIAATLPFLLRLLVP